MEVLISGTASSFQGLYSTKPIKHQGGVLSRYRNITSGTEALLERLGQRLLPYLFSNVGVV